MATPSSAKLNPRPSCFITHYAIFNNTNVTRCLATTGFSFVDPPAASTRRDPDEICANDACRAAYRTIFAVTTTLECQLQQAKYLYRDVMVPLSESSLCRDKTEDTSWFPRADDYNLKNESSEFPINRAPPDSSRSHKALVVAVVAGALVALALAVFGWRRHRRRYVREDAYVDPSNAGKTASIQSTAGSNESANVSSLWSDQVLLNYHLRPEELQDVHLIGVGGYGVVYMVRYRQTRLLASKRLAPERASRAATHALIDEIKLVAKLDHPSIVHFVGAAWTKESDLQALFEYMPNGDLTTYLTSTRPEPPAIPTWNASKLQIAIDIIEALVYVHSFSPPLVHRDLKARNVLLDADMRAKLSDFGVSRFKSDAHTMTTGIGTSRWLAPEVILGGGDYDERCDIYSFGIVLAEMDSHQLPFTGLLTAAGMALPEMTILQLVAEGKLRPTFSSSCPEKLRMLAMQCVAFDPNARPSAMEIAFTLRRIANEALAA